jgi:guanylate kinase
LQKKKIKGSLFIVSAPSGAGKTTLCKKIISRVPNLKFSVSYTTRYPRPGEVSGTDYTFVSREDFRGMIDREEFMEWAEVHGELYGTFRDMVGGLLASGYDVILDIDTQGALQLKNKIREGTFIFILPPSLDILNERLKKRMTDSPEALKKRLERAVSEIQTYSEYDYVIINDRFDDAIRELEAIVIAQRVRTENINSLWIKENFLDQEAR